MARGETYEEFVDKFKPILEEMSLRKQDLN